MLTRILFSFLALTPWLAVALAEEAAPTAPQRPEGHRVGPKSYTFAPFAELILP